jgi:hypothetical protein
MLVFDKKILKDFQCMFTLALLSPLGEELFPLFKQTWIPFTKVYFVFSLIKFGLLVLEKKILKNFQYIFTLSLLSPLGERLSPSFEQTWYPLPKNDLCQVRLKLAQWFSSRRFLNDATPFLHFCDYLPFEEDLALYLSKLKFSLTRIICTKFDWIWPSGSGEQDF